VIPRDVVHAGKIEEIFDFMTALEEVFTEEQILLVDDQLEEYIETARRSVIQRLLKEARRVLREGET
jgi:hypothetical protein